MMKVLIFIAALISHIPVPAQQGFVNVGGEIWYYDGVGGNTKLSNVVPSAVGQAGKVLGSNGTNPIWQTLSGGGDMVGANNLSDVANAATARTNLGLSTTANLVGSTNKNFVTDAQLTVIGNTSGTNTGDNATNTQYSGLAASKENTITAGTGAQYLKGDKSLGTYSGYSINVQALTSSPADGATIYFGMLPKAPVTAAGTSRIYIRQAGTIKRAEIYCFSGTAGTNEAWIMSIRLNNTTDTQIASVSLATGERVFSNTGLSIAVSAGDYIEIKCVNPTWATNPLTSIFGGYIYIE